MLLLCGDGTDIQSCSGAPCLRILDLVARRVDLSQTGLGEETRFLMMGLIRDRGTRVSRERMAVTGKEHLPAHLTINMRID